MFDHRRAEKISDDVIANCHQCGNPCDNHVNCANEACHLLFIQCNDCSEKMERLLALQNVKRSFNCHIRSRKNSEKELMLAIKFLKKGDQKN